MTAETVKSKEDDEQESSEEPKLTLRQRVVGELKFFLGLAVFLLVFWTTIFGHFKIPSESMQPTLEVGDRLYVSKFAYGFSKHSLPVGLHHLPVPEGRVFTKMPKRGDVAVFRHPYQGIVMIKRVVGLPGDTIRMNNGRLFVNDQMIDRKLVDERKYRRYKDKQVIGVKVYEEQFDGEEEPHLIYEMTDRGTYDQTTKFIVPADSLFFMGDNRDGSADSRAPVNANRSDSGPGYVHIDYLIGRADLMMFSFYKCDNTEGLYCSDRNAFSKIE